MRGLIVITMALLGGLLQAQTVQQPTVPVLVHRKVTDGFCDLVDKGVLRNIDGNVVVVLESDPAKPLQPARHGTPFSTLEYLAADATEGSALNLIEQARDAGFAVASSAETSFPTSTPFVQPVFKNVRIPDCPGVEGALQWLSNNPVPPFVAPPKGVRLGRRSGFDHPHIRYGPEPAYSEEGKKKRIEGTVVLMLIVQEDGRPASAIVVQALGYGLDQMALEAVRNWRFDPAKKDGKPISVEIEVETKFQLPPL